MPRRRAFLGLVGGAVITGSPFSQRAARGSGQQSGRNGQFTRLAGDPGGNMYGSSSGAPSQDIELSWRRSFDANHASVVGPDDRLYLLFDNGKILSLDTGGTSYEMSLINRMPNEIDDGLIRGTRLFVNDTENTMAAFETQDGTRIWQRTHTNTIGEPVHANGALYYPTTTPSVIRVDPESGSESGEITFPSRIRPNSVSDPPLIVTNAHEQSSTPPTIYGAVPGSSGGVFAYDTDGDTIAWTKSIEDLHRRTVATGGALFAASDSTIYRFDAQTGQTAWQRDRDISSAQIAFVAPNAVVVWGREKLVAVSPSDGSALWESGLQAPDATAVIGGNEMTYVIIDANQLTIVGIDSNSGLERWRRPFCQGREWRTPALSDRFLLVPADQTMYAFANDSGPRQTPTNETAANNTVGN